jgi:nitrogen fixation-related uncharacterized protein
MEPSTPLKLRRVLVGVVVGLMLVAVAFFGWVAYRRSQYGDHQHAVLSRYHQAYSSCVAIGTPEQFCGARMTAACLLDPFWTIAKPFAFDPGTALPDKFRLCQNGVPPG